MVFWFGLAVVWSDSGGIYISSIPAACLESRRRWQLFRRFNQSPLSVTITSVLQLEGWNATSREGW